MFPNFLAGYLAVCSGIVLLGAVWLFVARARLWWRGGRTTGEVVAYTTRAPSRRGYKPHYMPHVRFTERSGMPREFISTTSADPHKWPLGTRVPVAFDADGSGKAEIAVPWRFWSGPAAVLILGLGVLAAAVKAAG